MKKKIIIIVSIIIVLIVCSTAAFFIIKNNKSKNNTEVKEKEVEKKEEKPEEKPQNSTDVENPSIPEKKYDYKKKTLTKKKETDHLLTFDANGGKEVDDILVTKDGDLVNLPTPEREGYFFNGWAVGEGNEQIIYKGSTAIYFDMDFKAHWLTLNSTDRTMTISFDTNNLVDYAPITIICNKPIQHLPYFYPQGYEVSGWVNDDGTKITSDSILTCKDITLHLKYKKAIEYVCPDDYVLNMTNCYKYVDADTQCTGDTVLFEDLCLNPKDIVIPEKKCNKTDVVVGVNHEYQTVEGKYVGNDTCVYKELPYTNEKDCRNNGGLSQEGTMYNGKCYAIVHNYPDFKCPDGYRKMDNAFTPDIFNINPKESYCIKIDLDASKCPDGYEFDSRNTKKCYKYEKATIKK